MKYKILIVDDHLVVKVGVSIILKNIIPNLEISYACNYSESLQKIKTDPFDLIILDINIPGGKNTEMIAEIRAILSKVKILMLEIYCKQ